MLEKAMRVDDQGWAYTVTPEEYDAEIASGLTDEEVLRPGKYQLRRNPWAEKLRKAGKVKVTVYRGEEIVEEQGDVGKQTPIPIDNMADISANFAGIDKKK